MKKIFSVKNILCIIFLLICFGLFSFDLNYKKVSLTTLALFLLIGTIICAIIFAIIYFFKKIEYKNYHIFYCIIISIFGIIFMVIAPPYMGSDEKPHFLRAYEISEGHLISKSDKNGILAVMPRSLNKAYSGHDNENIPLKDAILYKDIPSRLAIPLNKNNLLSYCNCNLTNYFGASLYSPFQYLPQITGIIIGKLLNLGPILMLYLARVCNLLCFILITTIGIKLLPKFKLPFMLVLLSPVVLAGASTVSADGFTNAITFLFIAYIIHIIYKKKELQNKDKILLTLITFFIAMCKIVYIPLVFLVLLISKKCFKNKKENILFKTWIIMFGFIMSFIWLYLAMSFMDSQTNAATLHKTFMFSHPFEYFFIIVRTYFVQFDQNIMNLFFGNQLYHWQLKVYPILSITYGLVIFLSLFTKNNNLQLTTKSKVLILTIISMIILLISSALFVQMGMDYQKNIIGGIQARYFIPIIFMLPLLLNIRKAKYSNEMIFSLFILLYLPTIFTIIIRFI